jgi:bifunctional DNA-binding transcriptional regulator/antitoxin component of YhaV-PrlF toxin-antitoxin module
MIRTVKMDRSGRVVVPLIVRERYGLVDGDYRLEVHESAEGILLRPRWEEIPVERHPSGWVVFRSADREETDPVAAVEETRARRHDEIAGDNAR